MHKTTVHSKAVEAIRGTFALATRVGPFLFVSGKGALRPDGRVVRSLSDLDPEDERIGRKLQTGRVVTDLREQVTVAQTTYIYCYLRRLLEEQGSSLKDIIRQTIYMVDLNEFPVMERVRMHFLPDDPPATTTVGVTELAPIGSRIEIEVMAYMPEGKP